MIYHDFRPLTALTPPEQIEAWQVVIAEAGQQNITAGVVLAIRDGRLYKADYSTFEDYCRERWRMSRNGRGKLSSMTDYVKIGSTEFEFIVIAHALVMVSTWRVVSWLLPRISPWIRQWRDRMECALLRYLLGRHPAG